MWAIWIGGNELTFSNGRWDATKTKQMIKQRLLAYAQMMSYVARKVWGVQELLYHIDGTNTCIGTLERLTLSQSIMCRVFTSRDMFWFCQVHPREPATLSLPCPSWLCVVTWHWNKDVSSVAKKKKKRGREGIIAYERTPLIHPTYKLGPTTNSWQLIPYLLRLDQPGSLELIPTSIQPTLHYWGAARWWPLLQKK